jgi:sulfur transfer protein SufE
LKLSELTLRHKSRIKVLGLAARWREPQNVVPPPITERVKKLRQEIAELTEKNRRYSLNPKYGSAVADNERRFQRLIEIAEELKSLTDWKKT